MEQKTIGDTLSKPAGCGFQALGALAILFGLGLTLAGLGNLLDIGIGGVPILQLAAGIFAVGLGGHGMSEGRKPALRR